MAYTLTVSALEDEATSQAIILALRRYNESRAGPSHYQPLVVSLRDEAGQVVGGASGYTAYGWLFVQLLVVPEDGRGAGLGRRLMERIEAEAIARGCHDAWLDTHAFQARGFYEKLGYAEFGQLPDYPPPFARHFLRKRLAAA